MIFINTCPIKMHDKLCGVHLTSIYLRKQVIPLIDRTSAACSMIYVFIFHDLYHSFPGTNRMTFTMKFIS